MVNKSSIFVVTETQFAIQTLKLQPNCTPACGCNNYAHSERASNILARHSPGIGDAYTKWQDGDTVVLISFRVYNFVSAKQQ